MGNDDNPRRTATVQEIVAVNDLLKSVLTRAGKFDPAGKEMWKYIDGWNDDKVMAEMGNNFPRSVVRRIRQQMYGLVRGVVKEDKTVGKPLRLNKLNKQIEQLQKLTLKLNGDVDTMGEKVSRLQKQLEHIFTTYSIPSI